ncbi:MAG: hypothetical protein ACLFUS_05035 [Candidatus Sumerlaeia bacterium]
MRNLFIVLAKLMGLVMLYWAILTAVTMAFGLGSVYNSDPLERGFILSGLIASCVNLILSLGMALLLVFRTNWLADRVKVPGGDIPSMPDVAVIMRIGVQLIGIYIIATGIPWLTTSLINSNLLFRPFMERRTPLVAGEVLSIILPAAVKVAIGFFLALKATPIINWINPDNNRIIPAGYRD